jgi:hypothetical protein
LSRALARRGLIGAQHLHLPFDQRHGLTVGAVRDVQGLEQLGVVDEEIGLLFEESADILGGDHRHQSPK